MWHIWYYSGFFDRYVYVPGALVFQSNVDARCFAANLRAQSDISCVVFPY